MFNIIRKTDAEYNSIAEAAAAAESRFNYTLLASTFNNIELNEMVAFEYPKNKLANISLQLAKRGLIRDVDYQLVSVEGEGEVDGSLVENAVVTRLSAKVGTEVEKNERRPRGPLTEAQKNQRATTRAFNAKAKAKSAAAASSDVKGPVSVPAKSKLGAPPRR